MKNVPMISPATAADSTETETQDKHLYIKAKGVAFRRVDNETIRQCDVELALTLELGERNGTRIKVLNANGTVAINGTSYIIESGEGVILTRWHVAYVRCKGVDASGNEIALGVRVVYFWWGGNLYAFRAKALLKTEENPWLLLLRGVAKVY
jgi:hypothetical protein